MKRFCIHQWPCCSSVFSFKKINDLLYQLNHYQSSSKYILIFILKKSSKSPSAWSIVTGYYFIFQHHDLKYLWFPWRHDCSFHHHYVWKINNVKQIGDKYSDIMGFSQMSEAWIQWQYLTPNFHWPELIEAKMNYVFYSQNVPFETALEKRLDRWYW